MEDYLPFFRLLKSLLINKLLLQFDCLFYFYYSKIHLKNIEIFYMYEFIYEYLIYYL